MRIWEASAWLQTTFPPGVEIWDQRLWNDMVRAQQPTAFRVCNAFSPSPTEAAR